jgi:plasmid stabilization system protein ParE
MKPLRLLAVARDELQQAAEYYEDARPGLGRQFIDEFIKTLDRISENPSAWAMIDDHHRRCRLHGFPYGVIYLDDVEEILIVTVWHLHRKPDSWRRQK